MKGRPIESYENYEIYDNSPDYLQYQRNVFNELQGRPIESYENCKITKFTKTAKFTIIRQTTYKINEIYSKGCREGPSKVMKIAKITKFTKTAKFAEICKTMDKINEN